MFLAVDAGEADSAATERVLRMSAKLDSMQSAVSAIDAAARFAADYETTVGQLHLQHLDAKLKLAPKSMVDWQGVNIYHRNRRLFPALSGV